MPPPAQKPYAHPQPTHDGGVDNSGRDPADAGLNGSGQQPIGDQNVDWTAILDDDNRQLVQSKGWDRTGLNEALKSYRELSSKLGERFLTPPADDAGQDEWDAFHTAMGRPETPEQYEFGVPQGVPEDTPYDAQFATEFKTWAHKHGLSPRQAAGLHDDYVRMTAEHGSLAHTEMNQSIESAHEAIVKEFGDPETDGYRRNVELARRTLKQNPGLEQALTAAGLLQHGTGMITNADVFKHLARTGASMFAEDDFFSGPGANIENPFSEATWNLTKQSLLIKNDPAKAANLIRASGGDPQEYGLGG